MGRKTGEDVVMRTWKMVVGRHRKIGKQKLRYGYLSEKVSFWLFKIFEFQKVRTVSFNDILRLCTIVVNIAIGGSLKNSIVNSAILH